MIYDHVPVGIQCRVYDNAYIRNEFRPAVLGSIFLEEIMYRPSNITLFIYLIILNK